MLLFIPLYTKAEKSSDGILTLAQRRHLEQVTFLKQKTNTVTKAIKPRVKADANPINGGHHTGVDGNGVGNWTHHISVSRNETKISLTHE